MIGKHKLIKGEYYIGTCRNTNIAQWSGKSFIFINYEFHRPYIESIPFFGDVRVLNTDGFIPIQHIKINVDNIVQEKFDQDCKNTCRKIYKNHNIKSIKGEIWKGIVDYSGIYEVSNYGRVKNIKSNKIIKQNFSREYLVLGLTNHIGKRKTHRVHRLVAKTFVDGYIDGYEVNHKNHTTTDNRSTNLEWVTHCENSKKIYNTGSNVYKLTVENVKEIKNLLNEGDLLQKEIAKKFNVGISIISDIKTGKKWVDI